MKKTSWYGYYLDNKLVAVIGMLNSYVMAIGVLPEYRKFGISKLLVNHFNGKMAHVSERNQPSLRLFKSLGFKTKGRIENFYTDGSAAIYLEKQ